MSADSRQRDQFVLGLQISSGLLLAQQVAGKAARDGLFLSHFGPGPLPAMIAGAAVFSIILSLLSGQFLSRSAPRHIVPWALCVSGLLQLVEWWLLGISPSLAPVLIYLHMAGFGAVLLSSFWSMMNEEFDPREAKRRFGQIAAGGTIGGLLGGLAAERTVAWLGAPPLLLGLAALHIACGLLLAWLDSRNAPATPPPLHQQSSPAQLHRSSLLTTLAVMVLLASVGAALLDYTFKVYATESFGRGAGLVRFFALFHTGVALFGFLMQSAIAKYLLERFGLGSTAMALPATLLGGSFLSLLFPGLNIAAFARAAEAAVRGSIFRAGYETCFTAVPAAERRVAKTFIDVASDRGGDAVGMAIVFLCVKLGAGVSLIWVLGFACTVGLASLILCSSLDRIYLKALARNLVARAVDLAPESEMDLTTRSLVLRSGIFPSLSKLSSAPAVAAPVDPVTQTLCELRSSDLRTVQSALQRCDVSQPLIATQVVQLLGRDDVALLAHTTLHTSADRLVGLFSDLMLNPEVELAVRRRLPRIIGSVWNQRALDALLAGLEDPRFEVRFQCARTLLKTAPHVANPVLPRERLLAAVDRELSKGRLLWESQQIQHDETEYLDELLKEKAHSSMEYVFTLLSLLYDRTPLMAAFRSLHVTDRHLRGTALEYLEGILPPRTRQLLWDIVEHRPDGSTPRSGKEVLDDLLASSETVVLRLRPAKDVPPAD